MKTIRPLSRNKRRLLLKLGSAFFIIALWEISSWLIGNPKLLPDIYYILTVSLPSVAIFSGHSHNNFRAGLITLASHSGATISRILIGFVLGASIGLAVGLGVHFFRHSRRGNALVLTIVRAIPLFALVPLFLYWFGGSEVGIYLYIAFSVFTIIATNSYEAVFNVHPAYIQQALLQGATRYQVFRTVIFFAIQPQMIGSLRNILGLSWAFSLGAEYLSARSGLGYLLYQSYIYADMGKLILLASLYAAFGIFSFILTRPMLNSLRSWDST